MEASHRLPSEPPRGGRPGELSGAHDGSGLRIAVVCARFNGEITLRLLDGAYEALYRLQVSGERRLVAWVPGAFELPLAAKALAAAKRADAVVCLGAVIRGETSHYDFVAGECARGLQQVQLETGVPVVFGVLTTETMEQALERSGGRLGNKGEEAVVTAVEMANLLPQLR
ncbi:MAG TPA: 6,7-dimethyl-8-ribityllumazine synthase [Acidimicrobiales bacterium]|nr:6,7-dimethyl-8-ribityllumazine synthase [Acidimicrobiales bacterium]